MIFFLSLVVVLISLGLIALGVVKAITAKPFKWTHALLPLPGIAILISWLSLGVPSIGTVVEGERGIVLSFGKMTGRTMGAGLYFTNPFAGETVVRMNVQTVKGVVAASAASADLQNVTTQITINYNLKPEYAGRVFAEYRDEYAARTLTPAILEAVKQATAKFNAEDLIRQRAAVKSEITRILRDRMNPTHNLSDISITDFAFSPEFAQAIEAKVTATQQALKAQNDLATKKFEAEQRVATARGEAEAIKIQAEAIQSQGGAAYVQLKAIEQWNGVLPTTMMPGSTLPFINLNR